MLIFFITLVITSFSLSPFINAAAEASSQNNSGIYFIVHNQLETNLDVSLTLLREQIRMPSEMHTSPKKYQVPSISISPGKAYIRQLEMHKHEEHGTCRLANTFFKTCMEVKLPAFPDQSDKALLYVLYILPAKHKDQKFGMNRKLFTLECSEVDNFIKKLMSS